MKIAFKGSVPKKVSDEEFIKDLKFQNSEQRVHQVGSKKKRAKSLAFYLVSQRQRRVTDGIFFALN
jgi:hypothetical protein